MPINTYDYGTYEYYACTFTAVAVWQPGGLPWRNVTNHPGCCSKATSDNKPEDNVTPADSAIGLDVGPCNITSFMHIIYNLTFTRQPDPVQGLLTDEDCAVFYGDKSALTGVLWNERHDTYASDDYGSINRYMPDFKCNAASSMVSNSSTASHSQTSMTSILSSPTVTTSRSQNSSMIGAAPATATISAARSLFAHPLVCILPLVLSVLTTTAV